MSGFAAVADTLSAVGEVDEGEGSRPQPARVSTRGNQRQNLFMADKVPGRVTLYS